MLRNKLHIFVILFLSVCSIDAQSIEVNGVIERPIVVIVASYNNRRWYNWNLNSIRKQNYTNYRVIYTDDASTDTTGDLVERYIQIRGFKNRVTLVRNTQRCGALANLYRMIMSCDDEEIIAIVDGDDFLAHDNVLATINKAYEDPNVWLTYGQFEEYPSKAVGFCQQIPKFVIKKNLYRHHNPQPSHLRTFYAKLFKKIHLKDLLYEGKFFAMTYDLAMMMPMIEMAGERFKFIPEVLYKYNTTNPINDHKVNKDLQRKLDIEIRGRPKYKRLNILFDDALCDKTCKRCCKLGDDDEDDVVCEAKNEESST